jgi:hypothetical protein
MHITNTDESDMIADRIPAVVKTEDRVIMAKSVKDGSMSCQSHVLMTKVWPPKEYTIPRRGLCGCIMSRKIVGVVFFLIRVSHILSFMRPLLWSSAQSSWLQIQRSRVRFPVLLDFLRSSVSGTESTQPLEDN